MKNQIEQRTSRGQNKDTALKIRIIKRALDKDPDASNEVIQAEGQEYVKKGDLEQGIGTTLITSIRKKLKVGQWAKPAKKDAPVEVALPLPTSDLERQVRVTNILAGINEAIDALYARANGADDNIKTVIGRIGDLDALRRQMDHFSKRSDGLFTTGQENRTSITKLEALVKTQTEQINTLNQLLLTALAEQKRAIDFDLRLLKVEDYIDAHPGLKRALEEIATKKRNGINPASTPPVNMAPAGG